MEDTKKTLKEHLILCVEGSTVYDKSSNEDLFEWFELYSSEKERVLFHEGERAYEWMTVVSLVIDGKERYFRYVDVVPNNPDRDDREDCGGWTVPDIDDIVEVFPQEVVTTITKYVPLTEHLETDK